MIYSSGDTVWRQIKDVPQFRNSKDKVAEGPRAVHSGERVWVLLVRKRDGTGYKQKGPYATDEIRRLIHDGEVSFTDYVWRDGFKEWYKIVALSEFHLVTTDDDKTNVVREIPENVIVQKPVQKTIQKTAPSYPTPPHPEEEVTEVVTRKVRKGRQRRKKTTSLAQVARTTLTEYFFSLNQVQRGAVIGAGLLGFVSIVVIVGVASSFADRKNQTLSVPAKAQLAVAPTVATVTKHSAKPSEKSSGKSLEKSPEQSSAQKESPPREAKVAPTFLNIRVSKTGSDNATIGIVTNASSHFPVKLKFSCEEARCLGWKSYEKTIVLRRLQDRNYELKNSGLPSGYFQVEANVGDHTAHGEVFFRTTGKDYREAYHLHRKKLSLEHNEERYGFIKTIGRLETHAWQLLQGAQNSKSRSAWNGFYKSWRKTYSRIKNQHLDRYSSKRHREFVHGDKWRDLVELQSELKKMARKINAAATDVDSDTMTKVKDLAQRLGKLKERMINSSLWKT